MTQSERLELKRLVRTLYDFQDLRIRTAGRLRRRADGSEQDDDNMPPLISSKKHYKALETVQEQSSQIEKLLTKEVKQFVENQPIWGLFFKDVKGVGPLMAGAMLAEFDIEKATTVSKMWQFAGLNPGLVRGKKWAGSGKDRHLVETDELIRGDKRKAGFVSPFNGWLRTKLVGVLADCLLRARSHYALEYYYPYRERLKNSDKQVTGRDIKWSETSDGHQHLAAKRYMIKHFLRDLYVAWRTAENLPVRPPYAEEYLGKVHEK